MLTSNIHSIQWAQRNGLIFLTVPVPDVTDYAFELTQNKISFSGTSNNQLYSLELELFKEVEIAGSMWKKLHSSIQMKIYKKRQDEEVWPRLVLSEEVKKESNVEVVWDIFAAGGDEEGFPLGFDEQNCGSYFCTTKGGLSNGFGEKIVDIKGDSKRIANVGMELVVDRDVTENEITSDALGIYMLKPEHVPKNVKILYGMLQKWYDTADKSEISDDFLAECKSVCGKFDETPLNTWIAQSKNCVKERARSFKQYFMLFRAEVGHLCGTRSQRIHQHITAISNFCTAYEHIWSHDISFKMTTPNLAMRILSGLLVSVRTHCAAAKINGVGNFKKTISGANSIVSEILLLVNTIRKFPVPHLAVCDLSRISEITGMVYNVAWRLHSTLPEDCMSLRLELSTISKIFALGESLSTVFADILLPYSVLATTKLLSNKQYFLDYSLHINEYLQMQGPPNYRPPCCMLCRKIDTLESSTSHVLSNCILNLYDTKTAKEVYYDTNTGKVKHSESMKWKMLCKDCEQMFSQLGETHLGPWMQDLFLNGSVEEFAGEVYTKGVVHREISPLFHAICGNVCRHLLYSGPDNEEAYHLYYTMLETTRRYFVMCLSSCGIDISKQYASRVIEYGALAKAGKSANFLSMLASSTPPPVLYCFANPQLIEVLRSRSKVNNCGLGIHSILEGKDVLYCHLNMYGLHMVMLNSEADVSILFGGYDPVMLAKHRITVDSTRVYIGKDINAIAPLPAVLQRDLKTFAQNTLTSLSSTCISELQTLVKELPNAKPLNVPLLEYQYPWEQEILCVPDYVAKIRTASRTEFSFTIPTVVSMCSSISVSSYNIMQHFSLFVDTEFNETFNCYSVWLFWETIFENNIHNLIAFRIAFDNNYQIVARLAGRGTGEHLPSVYWDNVATVTTSLFVNYYQEIVDMCRERNLPNFCEYVTQVNTRSSHAKTFQEVCDGMYDEKARMFSRESVVTTDGIKVSFGKMLV